MEQETVGLYEVERKTFASQKLVSVVSEQGIGHFTCDMLREKYTRTRVLYLIGTAVAQWLRCCATNRKVAGLIPDGLIGIFHSHNPSDRSMALGVKAACM